MNYIDRLQIATFISASGKSIDFRFKDILEKSFDHKLGKFDNDGNGVYYQDKGIGGLAFPMKAKFSGNNCDLDADEFVAALSEKGHATLEHPIYGSRNIVVGSVSEKTDPINRGGEVIIDVQFFETIELDNQSDNLSTTANDSALDEVNNVSAQDFQDNLIIANLTNLKTQFSSAMDKINNGLNFITQVQNNISIEFLEALGRHYNQHGYFNRRSIKHCSAGAIYYWVAYSCDRFFN